MNRFVLAFVAGTLAGTLVCVGISVFLFHDAATPGLWLRAVVTMAVTMAFVMFILNRRQKRLTK